MAEIIATPATNVGTNINDESNYFPIVIGSDGSFTITNSGTAAAACRITIVPKFDIMQLEIEGLTQEKITMTKIMGGQLLIIDGINRTVTLDGENAFENYDAWELPRLQPGVNTIKITNADTMALSIEYQPRYI